MFEERTSSMQEGSSAWELMRPWTMYEATVCPCRHEVLLGITSLGLVLKTQSHDLRT